MTRVEAQIADRRKLAAAARAVKLRVEGFSRLPPALFLTDPVRTPDALSVMASLPPGWGVIYRHFGAPDRRQVAIDMLALARRRGLVFLVSADDALADLDVDGFHWPRSVAFNRRLAARPNLINTGSAHDLRQGLACRQRGLDACLLSSVFPSHSPSAPRPLGLPRFRRLVAQIGMPVYGLGGLSPQNAGSVAMSGGFAGVDMIKRVYGRPV